MEEEFISLLFLPVNQIVLRAWLQAAYQGLLRLCSKSPPFAAVNTSNRENKVRPRGRLHSDAQVSTGRKHRAPRAMPHMEPPRSSSSLSFSLPKVPISTPTWLKNVRDDFFVPPNGFPHLRGLFPKQIPI